MRLPFRQFLKDMYEIDNREEVAVAEGGYHFRLIRRLQLSFRPRLFQWDRPLDYPHGLS